MSTCSLVARTLPPTHCKASEQPAKKTKPGCANLLGECDEAAEDMVDEEGSVGESSEDSANDSAGSSEEFDVMPQGEASQQANDESVAESVAASPSPLEGSIV